MQHKYHDILKIFFNIQNTKPDDKLTTIEGYRDEMLKIQQHVISKDKEVKKQATRVQKGMRETVDLDGLAIKIYGKYLKFLQQKVHEVIDDPKGPSLSKPVPEDTQITKNQGSNINANDTLNFSELPIENSKLQQAAGMVKNAQKFAKMADVPTAQDLNTSIATVSSRYRHENQNSIYFLKPNSMKVYFLDFKRRGFCEEMIKWHKNSNRTLSRDFTSQQTSDANIYVVGGNKPNGADNLVLNDCIQIDANMTAYEREPMKTARYSAPLALIKDRFVLALGGYVSKYNITKMAECYDTHLNHWFSIAPLPTQVVNATTVTMNERFVYLMPGANRESVVGGSI